MVYEKNAKRMRGYILGRDNPKSRQNLKPIKKGEVRNPHGKRSPRNRSTIIKKAFNMMLTKDNKLRENLAKLVGDEQLKDIITLEEAMSLRMITEVLLKANPQAYKILLDSVYGLQKQEVEQNVTQTNFVVEKGDEELI